MLNVSTYYSNWPFQFGSYGVGRAEVSSLAQTAYRLFNANLRQQVKSSTFLQRIEHDAFIARELEKLHQLENNWDSYAADKPNAVALGLGRDVLRFANDMRIEVAKLVPSAEGGIGVCFVNDGRYAHIEASNEGELILMILEDGKVTELEELANVESVAGALEKIREQLGL